MRFVLNRRNILVLSIAILIFFGVNLANALTNIRSLVIQIGKTATYSLFFPGFSVLKTRGL